MTRIAVVPLLLMACSSAGDGASHVPASFGEGSSAPCAEPHNASMSNVVADFPAHGDSIFLSDVRAGVLVDDLAVLVEASVDQLLVFTTAGRFVRSIGRRGGGPGEFLGLDGVSRAGDRIITRELRGDRFSLFRTDGTLLSVFRPDWGRERGALISFGAPGPSTIAAGRFTLDAVRPGGVRQPRTRVDIVDAEGHLARDLGTWPLQQRVTVREASARTTTGVNAPFALGTLIAAGGGLVALVDAATCRVALYGLRADQDGEFTCGGRRLPVDEQLLTAMLDQKAPRAAEPERVRLGLNAGSWRRAHERGWAMMSHPDSAPFVEDVRVDANARIWLKRFATPFDSLQHWTAYDRTGCAQQRLTLPVAERVLDTAPSGVLTLVRGPDDVPSARYRALEIGTRSGCRKTPC